MLKICLHEGNINLLGEILKYCLLSISDWLKKREISILRTFNLRTEEDMISNNFVYSTINLFL